MSRTFQVSHPRKETTNWAFFIQLHKRKNRFGMTDDLYQFTSVLGCVGRGAREGQMTKILLLSQCKLSTPLCMHAMKLHTDTKRRDSQHNNAFIILQASLNTNNEEVVIISKQRKMVAYLDTQSFFEVGRHTNVTATTNNCWQSSQKSNKKQLLFYKPVHLMRPPNVQVWQSAVRGLPKHLF